MAPLISQYSKAFSEDGEKKLQTTEDEIENIIYDVGWCKYARVAPGNETEHLDKPISLYSKLNPETLYFRVVIDGRNFDLIENPSSWSNYIRPYFAIKIMSDLPSSPRYSAREILYTKKHMGIGYIAKVVANGRDLCCKMLDPMQVMVVQREYECLKKIADSKCATLIQVPRLAGLIVDGEDDEVGVIGILEKYIPHTMNLGEPGECIKHVATERKTKCAEQVRRNIELLHEIDVVWGDGKPQNVLVHSETDDCYLVDLGGSWTDGWVDVELRETKAGDDQALMRIFDF